MGCDRCWEMCYEDLGGQLLNLYEQDVDPYFLSIFIWDCFLSHYEVNVDIVTTHSLESNINWFNIKVL